MLNPPSKRKLKIVPTVMPFSFLLLSVAHVVEGLTSHESSFFTLSPVQKGQVSMSLGGVFHFSSSSTVFTMTKLKDEDDASIFKNTQKFLVEAFGSSTTIYCICCFTKAVPLTSTTAAGIRRQNYFAPQRKLPADLSGVDCQRIIWPLISIENYNFWRKGIARLEGDSLKYFD